MISKEESLKIQVVMLKNGVNKKELSTILGVSPSVVPKLLKGDKYMGKAEEKLRKWYKENEI